MNRSMRWSAIVAGVMIPAIGGLEISPVYGQAASTFAEPSSWFEASSALKATQQGGRPTIVVATTRTDAASQRLRVALPATLGRAFYLAEVDANDQAEWLRQIGITGLPGIAVYAHTEGGIKLMGTMSGMADPLAVAAWVPTLWKPANSTPNPQADPRVTRTSYQQASPQTQYFNPGPSAPAPSNQTYFVTTPNPAPTPAPVPVYIYQQTAPPAPSPAPTNYTTPTPAPMTISPTAAPIVVNPPQPQIYINPAPAPAVYSANPSPAPAPLPAPAPAPINLLPSPAPVQMVAASPAPVQMVAASPAPVQMVAASPVAASPVSTFVATAPAAAAPAPQNVVVAVRPLSIRNRIGTGLGQLLIDRNKPKFEVVQAANLAAGPVSPSFYAASPQGYAAAPYCPPAPVCQPSSQQYVPEPLPPLPSAQNQCPGCSKGGSFKHNHKN